MSKKIYGVPVTTPLNPYKIVPKGIVKSVNGAGPDENGNVKVDINTALATPQMYGAVADGVTDDTAAFVAALGDNDVVYVPEGQYIISEALYVGQGKTLYGSGIKSVLICKSPENFLMLNAQTTVRGFAIQMRTNGFVGNAITVNENSLATAVLNNGRVDITIKEIKITWHDYVYSQCANIELSLSGAFGDGRTGFYGVTISDVIADAGSSARDVGYFLRSYCALEGAWITYSGLYNCMSYAVRWGIFMHSTDENFEDAYANVSSTRGIDEFAVIGYRHQCDSNTKGFVYLRKGMRVQLTDSQPMDWQYAMGDYKNHPYCVDYDAYSTGYAGDHCIDIHPKPRIDRYMAIKPDGSVVKSDWKNLYDVSKNIGTQYIDLDLMPKQFGLKNSCYGACIFHTTSLSRIFANNTNYFVQFQLFDSDGIFKMVSVALHPTTPYIAVDRPLATQTRFGYIKTDSDFKLYIYSTRKYDFTYVYLVNLPITNNSSSYSRLSQSTYIKTINTFGWADEDKLLSAVPDGIVEITAINCLSELDKSDILQQIPDEVEAGLAQAKASGEFDGTDGVSVTHSWSGTTLNVTSASGTSSVDLKGDKGDTGAEGTSVTVKSVSESTEDGGSNVVTFSDGNTLTVKNGSKGDTGATGSNGADGKTPVKGTDYFTDADKAEMVDAVIAALPVYAGEVL